MYRRNEYPITPWRDKYPIIQELRIENWELGIENWVAIMMKTDNHINMFEEWCKI